MLRDLQNCGPLQNLGDEGLFDRTLFDFRSHQKWEIYNKQLTKDQQGKEIDENSVSVSVAN